ncbi:MAG: alpha/beta hydrolase-fold protein [Planctomycetota bacterium]|nr:alpha/beta hydrolase-fold protein [Planctomycetota bacterium]
MQRQLWICAAAGAFLLSIIHPARAQLREDVAFSISETTVPGQSIFVLGSLPELGGNDLRFAVKLEPSTYPVWKATISLPRGVTYSYRYYKRNDAAGAWDSSVGTTPLGDGPISASTGPAPAEPRKTVFAHTNFAAPIIQWRPAGTTGAFVAQPMHDVGPGRTAGERRWAARGFSAPGARIEFFITDAQSPGRIPAGATNFLTTLDRLFVQDAAAFSYLPPAALDPPRKLYTTTGFAPTTTSTGFFSPAMNEWRGYRVILPRGYDQHPLRRYPVLYLHDGQNVFEPGRFGDWLADETAERLVRLGTMREVILVGMDHTNNRITDYAAPDSGGWSNGRYLTHVVSELKPLIDAAHRTLAGPQETGVLGSSMGGQASLWFGWDRPDVFTRLGVFSGAWNVFTTGFYNRVRAQPMRPALRIYLDSGDSGASQDLFWTTVDLRDNFINPARASGAGGPYVLERNLRHVYGPDDQHNELAWARRLPGALEFLFPAHESPDELSGVPSARPQDVDDNDLANIEDLYAWETAAPGPASTLDVDRDGVLDEEADRAALLASLRSNEIADAGR